MIEHGYQSIQRKVGRMEFKLGSPAPPVYAKSRSIISAYVTMLQLWRGG